MSGLPMFGTAFPPSDALRRSPWKALGRSLLRSTKALNEPAKKDVGALLAQAANPDYRSYLTNEDYLTRSQLAGVSRVWAWSRRICTGLSGTLW